MGSERARISSVPEYLALLTPEQARVLKQVFVVVRRSVPRSKQVISYSIPAFRLEKVFMFCAAFKSHIGIYPPVRNDARLIAALKPYANDKGNLRFPLSGPVPYALIGRVARSLARSIAGEAKARSRPKAKARSRARKG